jgi:hypothetical protein
MVVGGPLAAEQAKAATKETTGKETTGKETTGKEDPTKAATKRVVAGGEGGGEAGVQAGAEAGVEGGVEGGRLQAGEAGALAVAVAVAEAGAVELGGDYDDKLGKYCTHYTLYSLCTMYSYTRQVLYSPYTVLTMDCTH